MIFQNMRKIDFARVWTLNCLLKRSRLTLQSISATFRVQIEFTNLWMHNIHCISQMYIISIEMFVLFFDAYDQTAPGKIVVLF